MAEHSHHQHGSGSSGAGRWVFWGFVLIVAYFLVAEHRAHVVQYLPFLLLAACPVLHFFHGHGSHRRSDRGQGGERSNDEDRGPEQRHHH